MQIMKLGVLFSGGKDSTYAMFKAKGHSIECLIALRSLNPESYMFHTPAIELVEKQAQALGLPLLVIETKGEKEKELADLKKAIKTAKEKYAIEGIVTGAVASTYQASRIQKICRDLGLWVFNPLWQIDQIKLLKELVENNFEIIITGIAAYPFDEKWLGKKIDANTIKELQELQNKFKINPAGEGGEYETLVLNSPMHKKRLEIIEVEKQYSNHYGTLKLK